MKLTLTVENCKCGQRGCMGKLLFLDGHLLDGVHSARIAETLQTAVNLHDELVEALRKIQKWKSALSTPRAVAEMAEIARHTLAKLEKRE